MGKQLTKNQLMGIKKTKDFCKAIEKLGFYFDRQTGNHMIYKHSATGKSVPIPANREIARGTARDICKMIWGYNYSETIEFEQSESYHLKFA